MRLTIVLGASIFDFNFRKRLPNGWLYRQKRDLAGKCQKAKKASGVNPIKSGEPPRFCPVQAVLARFW
jgi:hypothetical protein